MHADSPHARSLKFYFFWLGKLLAAAWRWGRVPELAEGAAAVAATIRAMEVKTFLVRFE